MRPLPPITSSDIWLMTQPSVFVLAVLAIGFLVVLIGRNCIQNWEAL